MSEYPQIINGMPRAEYFRQYRAKNRAKMLRYAADYRQEHREQINVKAKIKYCTNEEYRKREIARAMERYRKSRIGK